MDGLSRHLTRFDQLGVDESYASLLCTDRLASSHAIKRFFGSFEFWRGFSSASCCRICSSGYWSKTHRRSSFWRWIRRFSTTSNHIFLSAPFRHSIYTSTKQFRNNHHSSWLEITPPFVQTTGLSLCQRHHHTHFTQRLIYNIIPSIENKSRKKTRYFL